MRKRKWPFAKGDILIGKNSGRRFCFIGVDPDGFMHAEHIGDPGCANLPKPHLIWNNLDPAADWIVEGAPVQRDLFARPA